MKKLLILISAIFSLTASAALAKTEGSSVGVALLKSEVVHANSWNKNAVFKDNGYGVSLNAKHSIALANGFYIAPGVSYDRLGSTAVNTDTNFAGDKVSLNNRFSIRADLGYDINDHLAAYALAGYSALGYEVYNNTGGYSEKKNTYNYAPIVGAGLKTAVSKNIDLTLEYTHQQTDLATSNPYQNVKSKIETYAVGLAYNF